MKLQCVLCKTEVRDGDFSRTINNVRLYPLCIACDLRCAIDAQSIISEYIWLFDRNKLKPASRPALLQETAHPISGQQSQTTTPEDSSALANTASNLMNNRKTIGIIIVIIGVALIIISPSLLYVQHIHGDLFVRGDRMGGSEQITDLRDAAKFCGVALLIVGGIITAIGFSQSTSAQPTAPPTPTTQPVVIQSVSPKSVELGNTPDEVQLVLGNPDKIINLGARVIHVYKDMKIIYVDGKVSDVQLS